MADGIERSSNFGCKLGIFYLIFIISMIFYVIYKGLHINSEIDKFTSDKKVSTKIVNPTDKQIQDLKIKFISFASNFKKYGEANLILSVENINDLVSTQDFLKSLKGNFWLNNAVDNQLDVNFVLTFNGLPLIGKKRYLEGRVILGLKKIRSESRFEILNLETNNKNIISKQILSSIKEKLSYSYLLKNNLISEYANKIDSMNIENGNVNILFKNDEI